MDRPAGAESVPQQIERLGKATRPYTTIVTRWRDANTGLLYSLVEIDLNTMKRMADSHADIGADTRNYLRNRGGGVFDRMAKEGARPDRR